MLVPPCCLSCGCSIGHVAPIYSAIHQRRMKEKLKLAKVKPDKAAEYFALEQDNDKLLSDLGLKNDCCRICVTHSMQLKNNY